MFAFKIQTLISWHRLIQAKYRHASEGKYVHTSSTSNLLLYVIKYNSCCTFSKKQVFTWSLKWDLCKLYSVSCIQITTDKFSFKTSVFFRRRKPIFLTSLIWRHINICLIFFTHWNLSCQWSGILTCFLWHQLLFRIFVCQWPTLFKG